MPFRDPTDRPTAPADFPEEAILAAPDPPDLAETAAATTEDSEDDE